MLLSRDALADVIEVIRPGDHYRPAHQIIHEVALALFDRGDPVDAITVGAELAKRGEAGKTGGLPYLHTLIAGVPLAANAGYYARIVREKAILRGLVEAGMRITQTGYAGDADTEALVDRARLEVDGITTATRNAVPAFGDLLSETVLTLEDEVPRGMDTPWRDMNALAPLTGFTVVAARPAVGKSVAGMNLAAHTAIRLDQQAVIFSLEMARDELMMRLLASEARVPLDHLLHRQLESQDRTRCVKGPRLI